MSGEPRATNGVLLVYRRPISPSFRDATTVNEHLDAFSRYSRFPVYPVNTEWGFPSGLQDLRFGAIVMHYSLFSHLGDEYPFPRAFDRYLDASPDAYKIAFFQDEYMVWRRRAAFLNDHGFDCVFTCLEPEQFETVYGHHTRVPKIVSNIPGYVSEQLIETAERFTVPDAERTIDVGYRARPLDPWMGTDEKTGIGRRFAELAADSGLELDIALGEEDRLYGDDWYRFLAGCRCFLGVESGTTAFDLEDEVMDQYRELAGRGRRVTIEDMRGGALDRWEDRIYYRTISPRHFEAAALRVCQVLFEGRYSGLMEPGVHYVALRKDFSNFDEVMEQIRDPELRRELTENAHRDLIASGQNSYERFIEGFDGVLAEAGLRPGAADSTVEAKLRVGSLAGAAARLRSTLSHHPLLKPVLYPLSRPFLAAYRRLRRARVSNSAPAQNPE